MQKYMHRKLLQCLIAFTLFSVGCSVNSVPENYKNIVSKFAEETEKIEAIPVEENTQKTNGEVYKNLISLKKRAEYFFDNKNTWNKLFADFEQVKSNLKTTDWYDDVLFCMALWYLKASNISDKRLFADNAMSSISDFIGINNTNIEEWTKEELKSIFWNNFATYFSETVSEKENIDQFFYIARASLWENKKNNPEKAIEDYNKALNINPNSLWGKQAQNQIKFLQERMSEGSHLNY